MTRTSVPLTAKNHSAEVHRQEKRGRNLLLQCQRCGAKGTLYQRDDTKALAVKEGQQEAVNQAWGRYRDAERRGYRADAEKWLRKVRDLRRGKPYWVHVDCGGTCLPFDIYGSGAPSERDFMELVIYGVALRCDRCGQRITWNEIWQAAGKVERVARRVQRLAVGSVHGGCGGRLRA